jgi:cell division protein FtsL
MTRTVNVLLIFLMVLSAAAVYDMKYEAEVAAENVRRLEREIGQQQAAISLLKAEWSVLTQPARLQELAERHAAILQLTPMTANHVGTLADIPEKPVVTDPEAKSPAEGAVPPGPAQRSAEAAPDDTDDDLIR